MFFAYYSQGTRDKAEFDFKTALQQVGSSTENLSQAKSYSRVREPQMAAGLW